MSCKMGNRSHKEGCLKYKQEGRREKNKKLKAERNERRIARFAKRSAEKSPKTYVPKDPENRGSNLEPSYGDFAYRPRMEHMTPYQKERSFEQRIQNQLDAEILAIKKAEQQRKSRLKNKEGKD